MTMTDHMLLLPEAASLLVFLNESEQTSLVVIF